MSKLIDFTEERFKGMSKKQVKRMLKNEYYEANKKEWKKDKKIKKKERKVERKSEPKPQIIKSIVENKVIEERKKLNKKELRELLLKLQKDSAQVYIDSEFEDKQTTKVF